MPKNIFNYAAVICLTFSAMVQMLVIPQNTIIEEMQDKLRNCSFPPAEVLKESSQGGIYSVCAVLRPTLTGGKPTTADMNFAFGKYLCMELFDVSLQLCSMNVLKESTEEYLSNYTVSQNVSTFCERLQFSFGRAKSTRLWSDIAIETLKNRTFCESVCVTHNYLNPVCGAISLANKLLIGDEQKQMVGKVETQGFREAEPTILDSSTHDMVGEKPTQRGIESSASESAAIAAEVPPSDEHKPSQLKPLLPSRPIVKEVTMPKVFNMSSAENKMLSKTNEIRPPINEDVPKISEMNAVGPPLEKQAPVISPTQPATVTSTLAPAIIDTASIPVEKEEDREEDHNHQSGIDIADTPGIEDSRISPDDLPSYVPVKGMGQDTLTEEGLADEDSHIGLSNVNERLTENGGYHDAFVDAQDSHFFAYFLTMVVICIVGYLLFHNKQKIIALALEGRRMQGSRRRPNTSSYKKLDSNLEEAVTSTCSSSSVNNVIF